mmetsp:Transcript_31258/g.72716  ORF Transcript_31258/g.72716 Transcript_31258/m.72716 type:complete len:314 (-) Transcript_31258:313-1254(-)
MSAAYLMLSVAITPLRVASRFYQCGAFARGGSAALSYVASIPPLEPTVPLPNGLLVVHKPQNWTSFDVVGRLRNVLEGHLSKHGHTFRARRHLKVGHGGTLDPLAEGLVVIGVGKGCKQLQQYLSGGKGYVARARLGAETDSQDVTGAVIASAEWKHVSREALQEATQGLTGRILQRPPIFSALKRDGQRMYVLARKGLVSESDVERRPVVVDELTVTMFDASSGEFELRVRCSGGTYVRTLIVDLARAVGSAAHMVALERIQVGPFHSHRREVESLPTVEPLHERQFHDVPALYAAMEAAQKVLDALDHDGR